MSRKKGRETISLVTICLHGHATMNNACLNFHISFYQLCLLSMDCPLLLLYMEESLPLHMVWCDSNRFSNTSPPPAYSQN